MKRFASAMTARDITHRSIELISRPSNSSSARKGTLVNPAAFEHFDVRYGRIIVATIVAAV